MDDLTRGLVSDLSGGGLGPGGHPAAWLLPSLSTAGPLGGGLPVGQMLLECLDYLVDELAIRGRVPAEPEAGVAVEAVTPKHRWLMRPPTSTTAAELPFGAPLTAIRALDVERGWVAAAERPRDHVGEYLPVFEREDGG